MNAQDQLRFDAAYQQHLTALKLQGKAPKTIESYAFAVRRVAQYFDRFPDDLTLDELKRYFCDLIDSHSWSAIKIDRNGLRFFYQHVLGQPFPWVDMVKPPRVQSLPDLLSRDEIARIIRRTTSPRYRAFWLVAYSMGLRLGETLRLTVADIDAAHMRLHVRDSKGNKDRFVILPELALTVLRHEWRRHLCDDHIILSCSSPAAPVQTTRSRLALWIVDRLRKPSPKSCAIVAFARRCRSTACGTATPPTSSKPA